MAVEVGGDSVTRRTYINFDSAKTCFWLEGMALGPILLQVYMRNGTVLIHAASCAHTLYVIDSWNLSRCYYLLQVQNWTRHSRCRDQVPNYRRCLLFCPPRILSLKTKWPYDLSMPHPPPSVNLLSLPCYIS